MTQAQVLSSMAEGVCVCDETGKISFTNAAFEVMFGYDRSGLLLSKEIFDFEDCLDGEVSARLPEGFSQVLTKGYWRGDLLSCKRYGDHFNAHVRLTRLVLSGTTSIVCVWEDISVLKQAERELRESEQRFRAIFEGAQDLIFIKDKSLKYTQVNAAFAKLFSRSPKKIVGLKYEDLFGAEGAEYEKDLETRVLEGQTIEEERARDIKGIPMRFNEIRVPLRDAEGVVVRSMRNSA